MAATGKTPILLYGSTTATNVPVAGNLTNSSDGCEIAINVADKNLFFKDSTNAVNTVPIRQSSASSNGWLSSTDWSTFNSKQPAGSYALTTGTLAQFASTTSAQLAGVISDETGTGSLVFADSPIMSQVLSTKLIINPYTSTTFTTAKYNSQGVAWSADTTLNSYIFNGSATQRPEISWYRGSRTYPEFSIRQHTTNDTGGEIYAGGGTVAPTRVAEIKSTGWTFVGDTTLSTGNLVIGTSGKGIDFSVTSDGSGTATSELLADYEEGTWTPVIAGTTSAGTGTYATGGQVGTYTKIGNVVYFQSWTSWTNHTGTGNMIVTGLPYTSSASATTFHVCSARMNLIALTAGNYGGAYISTNATSIILEQYPTGGGAPAAVPLDISATLILTGFYTV